MVDISVIVPCYNVEKYVTECINSLKTQTHANIEIICVNDGSTDSTLKILQEHAKEDPRIRVINKENSGYGSSMNLGISLAKGKYIGILESDDFATSDLFSCLFKESESNNLDICRAGYYNFFSNKCFAQLPSYVPINKVVNCKEESSILYLEPAIWSSLYKREFLLKNNIKFLETPGASYQDTSFFFKTVSSADRFKLIPDILLYYRCDNASSSVHSKGKAFCICDEWEEIYHFVSNQTKRKGTLLRLIPALKLSCYHWNFKRLKGSLKISFLFRWWKDYLLHLMRREIDWSILNRKQKIKIATLLLCPFVFLIIN